MTRSETGGRTCDPLAHDFVMSYLCQVEHEGQVYTGPQTVIDKPHALHLSNTTHSIWQALGGKQWQWSSNDILLRNAPQSQCMRLAQDQRRLPAQQQGPRLMAIMGRQAPLAADLAIGQRLMSQPA